MPLPQRKSLRHIVPSQGTWNLKYAAIDSDGLIRGQSIGTVDDEGAVVDGGPAGVGVDAIERPRAGIRFQNGQVAAGSAISNCPVDGTGGSDSVEIERGGSAESGSVHTVKDDRADTVDRAAGSG